ncbi:MAG: hypothetical protein IJX17_03655 [Clostridia bacterium]|nr:hypothetical protein [Clostridia bacterium]
MANNYSDMKATKESRSDKLKEIAKSSGSNKSSGNGKSSNKTTRVIKKSTQRKAKREIKKVFSMMGLGWIIVVLCLVVGLVGGFFTTKYICRFDTYEMVAYENGEHDIIIGENEDVKIYQELGVKCIAFGKDCSSKYTVEYFYRNDLTKDEVKVDKVDPATEGIYYAVYTAPSVKYKKTVKLIRNIIVTKGEAE